MLLEENQKPKSKKKKKIIVNRVTPDEQECRLIILHVINQATKDYENFRGKTTEEEIELFNSAAGFLFNDEYTVDWGEETVTVRKLCDHIGIDIDWLRNNIGKRLDTEFLLDGTIIQTTRY